MIGSTHFSSGHVATLERRLATSRIYWVKQPRTQVLGFPRAELRRSQGVGGMADWVAVCRLDELREGAGRSLDALGLRLAIFRTEAEVIALSAGVRIPAGRWGTDGSRTARRFVRCIAGSSSWPMGAARQFGASGCIGFAARCGGMRSGWRCEARCFAVTRAGRRARPCPFQSPPPKRGEIVKPGGVSPGTTAVRSLTGKLEEGSAFRVVAACRF